MKDDDGVGAQRNKVATTAPPMQQAGGCKRNDGTCGNTPGPAIIGEGKSGSKGASVYGAVRNRSIANGGINVAC